MSARFARYATAALYQFSVGLGILLLPVALAASKIGVTIPVHRLVDAAHRVHRRHSG